MAAVAATSACNAWAVGSGANGALIEHWNGKAWNRQPSPSPGVYGNELLGVAATSAVNAWAVGDHNTGPPGDYSGKFQPLIEHWNGRAWKDVPSPTLHSALLNAVAAVSLTAAWAVGSGPAAD